MISFIVSAYDRPAHLRCCLACLALQAEQHEVIVCANGCYDANQEVCEQFGVKMLRTGEMGAENCYQSADLALQTLKSKWVCFPSDDSYLLPCFSTHMLHYAEDNRLDLVYCDTLYQSVRRKHPGILVVNPVRDEIDKTSFMCKRTVFPGFGPWEKISVVNCDGLVIEEMVKRGLRHDKCPGVLVVHI